MKLTIRQIRAAVRQLKKRSIQPQNGAYLMPVRRGAMVDLLLCYKRPRSTKLYKEMRNW